MKLRAFALLSILFLLAAACSKPKEQISQTGGEHKGASALSSGDAGPGNGGGGSGGGSIAGPGGPGPGTPKQVSVNGPTKGYAALNPGADTKQAAKVGHLIKLQSTAYKTPNTWTGVTKDTIHLTFGTDKTNCGVNIVAAASAAGSASAKATRFYRAASTDQNVNNAREKEAIDLLVRYWNDHVGEVAADTPQAVEVMKKFNTPGHNFYGRKLTYDIVDAGSFQCKEKQTSAAITIRDQSKPFSTVVYDVPGLYENGVSLASAMKAKIPATQRPMIFGLLDTSDKYLSDFAPYAWDEFQSITKMSRLGAGWICSDLKPGGKGNQAAWGNGKAVNSNDTSVGGLKTRPRKFGLVYANNPNSNQAAAELKGFLGACGITFSKNSTEFQINDNPARATDEGNTIAARLKLSGVTSVIYLIDFLGALFHFVDYEQQGYKPEIVEIGTGWQTNTVQRAMISQSFVDRASMFYSSFGIQGFGYGPGDPFWVYHTYHKVSPKTHKACDPRTDAGMAHDEAYCKAPGQIVAWYYSWLPLIGGMIFAGPNLTPNTVSAGLQAYPLTRYGVDGPTSDPTAVLVGAGPGQYYFITDGSSGRWRSSFVSPPPERVKGFPDFPDCQRHYTSWPVGLAPQWEKGGSQFNAWCGNAKYTKGWTDQGQAVKYQPKTADDDDHDGIAEASDHDGKATGDTCEKLPAKKCETDGYPRWEPVLYR